MKTLIASVVGASLMLLPAIWLHGGPQFHQVFHVLHALLETKHLGGEGFQRWFIKR